MSNICVLLLSLGFEIGIGTTVKGTGVLFHLSGLGKKKTTHTHTHTQKKQLTLSGLSAVSFSCGHLL